MKFLVLGCNGMAGHMISLQLSAAGHDVTGFARKKSPFVETVVGDVHNENLLRETISGGKFDALVNCVGVLNQSAEKNQKEAVYLNSFLPHFIADVTASMSTQIIQMSTDCVFSGNRGGVLRV